MPSLHETLADFAGAIVRGNQPSLPLDAKYGNYTLDVALDVYRNNYRGNLHDALAGAYPVVEQLVGKDFFRLLVWRFIEKHDSASGNLHRYGAEMADFIAGFEPARELPYLPGVASLEWACHCAYFADNAPGLDMEKLAQISPEQHPDLVLHLHPACSVVRSRYPVGVIWEAHRPGADSDFHIDLDSGPCNLLVTRRKGLPLLLDLRDAETEWLLSVQAGTPLGEAADAVLERHPDFDLQETLLYLASQDVLCGFSLRSTS